jgi:hypothetical protein
VLTGLLESALAFMMLQSIGSVFFNDSAESTIINFKIVSLYYRIFYRLRHYLRKDRLCRVLHCFLSSAGLPATRAEGEMASPPLDMPNDSLLVGLGLLSD